MDPDGYSTQQIDPPPTYTIQPGDSPTKIAKIFGVTLWELAEANQGVRMENNTYFTPVPPEGERDWQAYWSREGRGKLWTLEAGDVLVNPNFQEDPPVEITPESPLVVATADPDPTKEDNIVDDVNNIGDTPSHYVEMGELNAFARFKKSVGIVTGADGFTIANHFKSGGGEDLIWGEQSNPSVNIRESRTMIEFQEQLARDFLALNDGGQLNQENAQAVVQEIRPPNLSGDSLYLLALVGGLQQYSVSITNVTENTIEFQLTVADRFGFDSDDINLYKSAMPGLVEGYMLQHESRMPEDRYRPFLQRFILAPFQFNRQ